MLSTEEPNEVALSDQRWKCFDSGELTTGLLLHRFIGDLGDTGQINALLGRIEDSKKGQIIQITVPNCPHIRIQRVR